MTANYIYAIAGNGSGGYVGDNVPATSTPVDHPSQVTVDASGNVYIGVSYNARVRFVPKNSGTYFGQAMTANYIYTIAGDGTAAYGGDGGPATSAQLNEPGGVALDSAGNVYISDYSTYRIRFIPKVSGTYFGQSMTANYVYTIAGGGGSSPDGVAATSANFNRLTGVSLDGVGNVYISTIGDQIHFIAKTGGTYFGRAMTANYIYTIVGTGAGFSGDGGAATLAKINNPYGVSVDLTGNLYFADSSNNRIRMVPRTTGAHFGHSMTANYIYTIAGGGANGFSGDAGVATSAKLDFYSTDGASGVCVDNGGNIIVGDYNNHRIRYVPKTSGTYFGQSMTANYIYTIAGTGTAAYGGDGGAATSAQGGGRAARKKTTPPGRGGAPAPPSPRARAGPAWGAAGPHQ
ncbi:MAG: hypothetical protein IPN90_11510 [Elusimicrobia bacterium]|nr:hypothetical protein [Elusimicrobiota bacterium]